MFIFYFQEIIYQGLKIPSLNICNKQLPNSQKKRGGGERCEKTAAKKKINHYHQKYKTNKEKKTKHLTALASIGR